MKKLVYLLLIVTFFIPLMAYASTDDIFIESIQLIDKSNNTVEVNPASFEKTNLKLDVQFLKKEDFVKYKLVLKNNSNQDYRVMIDSSLLEDTHVKYSVSFSDNSDIIKAHSSKEVTFSAVYYSEVSTEKFVNGRYVENRVISIVASNDNISNPKTSNQLLMILLIVMIIMGMLLLFLKNPMIGKKFLIILLLIPIVSPYTVFALEEIKITVNSRIEIAKVDQFAVAYWIDGVRTYDKYDYIEGMSIYEYYYSNFENKYSWQGTFFTFYSYELGDCLDSGTESSICYDQYGEEKLVNRETDLINSAKNGYYVGTTVGCLDGDTEVCVYDKKRKKRMKKKIKDVTEDDLLLAWDFDNGCLEWAEILWIKEPAVLPNYIMLTFDDGTKLKVVGDHSIYNSDSCEFVDLLDDYYSPIGMHTIDKDGNVITLIDKEKVIEDTYGYNIITKKHINFYGNGILTSWNINNYYDIVDMKFVKEDRDTFKYEEFNISRDLYEGLRLSEVPENFRNDREGTLKYLKDIINRIK